MESRGFTIYPAVRDFLRQFGLLEFKVPREGREDKVDYHHTIPEKAMGNVFNRDDFREYETYAGEALVVVGEIFDRNLNIYISESGKVYSDLGKYSDNILVALDALFLYKHAIPWENLKNYKCVYFIKKLWSDIMSCILSIYTEEILSIEVVFDFVKLLGGQVSVIDNFKQGVLEKEESTIWIYYRGEHVKDKQNIIEKIKDEYKYIINTEIAVDIGHSDYSEKLALNFCINFLQRYPRSIVDYGGFLELKELMKLHEAPIIEY